MRSLIAVEILLAIAGLLFAAERATSPLHFVSIVMWALALVGFVALIAWEFYRKRDSIARALGVGDANNN